MGTTMNYWCSAECGKMDHFGDNDGAYGLYFPEWAKHHPEEILKNGRHFPKVYTCPWCGAPAYRAHTLEGERLHDRYLARRHLADQERQALRGLELDPTRIYVLSRGQARDVTALFRSPAATTGAN